MEIRDHLKFLRDSFSNEIPTKIIHGNIDQPKYKVKKNWFQGIIADAENQISEGYASKKSKKLFEGFIEYYHNSNAINRLTNREDIEKANRLLTSLINDFD
jgi:nucleoside diphosphate kinase